MLLSAGLVFGHTDFTGPASEFSGALRRIQFPSMPHPYFTAIAEYVLYFEVILEVQLIF